MRSDDRPTDTPAYPPNTYAWLVLAIMLGVYTYSFVDRQILGLLVEPIKSQLHISDTQLGILQGTSYALFYSLLGIPIGLLTDRYNRRNIIVAGLLLWSAATALCGLAESFWEFFVTRAAVGIGEACLAPAAFSILSDYFRPQLRGRAFTVYTSGVYVGAGLAFVVGSRALLLGQPGAEFLRHLGLATAPWQSVFILIGLAGVVLSPVLLFVREPLRHERSAHSLASLGLRAAMSFFRQRMDFLLPFVAALSCVAISNNAFFAWTPVMLQRIHGWQIQNAGYVFGSLLMVFGPVGMITAGVLVDARGSSDPKRFAVLLAATGVAAVIPFALIAGFSRGSSGSLIGLGGLAFCMSIPITMAPFVIQALMPNQFRGIAISVYVLIVNLTGLGVGPTTAGFISDRLLHEHSIGHALAIMAALLLPVSTSLFLIAARSLKGDRGRN